MIRGLSWDACVGTEDAKLPVMRVKKPMRSPFVITISVAAAAAGLMACGGKVNGGVSSGGPDGPDGPDGPGGSSGSSGTIGNPPPPQPTQITNPPAPPSECPAQEPTEGAACSTFGGGCSYLDRCEGRPTTQSSYKTYTCASGTIWKRLSDHYMAACPSAPPGSGESCASCAGDYPAQCTYSTNTGCPPVVAACDPKTLTWNTSVSSCNPPPPPQDAGAGGP